MKNIIITMAIIIYLGIIFIYQGDVFRLESEMEKVKWITEEVVADGVLNISMEDYGEGKIVFEDEKIVKIINDKLEEGVNKGSGEFWHETYSAKIYIADDKKTIRTYDKNQLIGERAWTNGDTILLKNLNSVIRHPTIAIVFEGNPNFKSPFLNKGWPICIVTKGENKNY